MSARVFCKKEGKQVCHTSFFQGLFGVHVYECVVCFSDVNQFLCILSLHVKSVFKKLARSKVTFQTPWMSKYARSFNTFSALE